MSELDTLPDGWSNQPLHVFISKLESGVSVNADDREKVGSEIGVLKTSCVSLGKFAANEHKAVWPTDAKRAKGNPREGEIIISRMNTPTLVGESGLVTKSEENLFLPDRLWQTVARTDTPTDFKWLNQVLQWGPIRKKVRDVATGTSNSMKNISKTEFLAIVVPTPSWQEQGGIAEVLSALDEQIEATDDEIQKHRHILNGLIDQLLLSGERSSALGTAVEVRPVSTAPRTEKHVPFVPMDAVTEDGHLHSWTSRPWAEVSAGFTRFTSGDVLVAKITPCFENGKGAQIPAGIEVGAGSTEFHVLRAKQGVDPRWIYWHTRAREFRIAGAGCMTGSSGQQRVPRDFIESFPVRALAAHEQSEIATCLDAIDGLIQASIRELEKLRLQKQGLMHDLLTGKTRVFQ